MSPLFSLGSATIFAASLLTACGGNAPPISAEPTTEDTRLGSLSVTASSQKAAVMATLSGDDINILLAANPQPVVAQPDGTLGRPILASMSTPTQTAVCSTWGFGSTAARCLGLGNPGTPGGNFGADTSAIAARNAYCSDLAIGQAAQGVLPSVGSIACYQFVVTANTNIGFQVQLPAGVVGIAEMYTMNTNGTAFIAARASGSTGLLSASSPLQNRRILLIVRVANGSGQAYALGINTASTPVLPINNTSSTAHTIDINEQLADSIPASQGVSHFFFPLAPGQTSSILTASYAPANVQMGVRAAQRTAPGVYNLGTETVLSSGPSAASPLTLTSPYPANVAGGSTVSGVMVRVSSLIAGTS
jgi:hypothetical protein